MELSEAFPPSKLRIHYDLLHELSDGEQTALAKFHAEKTHLLANRFASSVDLTLSSPKIANLIYGELDEEGIIVDDRTALPVISDPHQIDGTDPFAAYIKDRLWTVHGSPDLTFTYVDRELSPLRITEKGGARPSVRWLDLLLREHEAGQPIVTELKVRRDSLPYYALTQSLMYAADLCGSNQFERLNQLLPEDAEPFVWLGDRPSLDVAVIFFEPPESGWTYWVDSLNATRAIVANLNEHPEVNQVVREIRLIEGTIVENEISFTTLS